MMLAATILALSVVQAPPPLRIAEATISTRHVVFSRAGQLWIVDRSGGEARPIARMPGIQRFPVLSPDGASLAFSSGPSMASLDVFVVPLVGGNPQQLTFHPATDLVRAWADSATVIFASDRLRGGRTFNLYSVGRTRPLPSLLPFPSAWEASVSRDRTRMAVVPGWVYDSRRWKHYRGGLRQSIALTDRTGETLLEQVPRVESTDRSPVWGEDHLFFVSDRSGSHEVHRYSESTGAVDRVSGFGDFGIDNLAGSDKGLVAVAGGRLYSYEAATNTFAEIPITLPPSASGPASEIVSIAGSVQEVAAGPNGGAIAIRVRGEIFVSTDTGRSARLVTGNSATAERGPAVAADNRKVAFFSDSSGEYELVVHSLVDGRELRIPIEKRPSFYRELTWSPDGRLLAFSSLRSELWIADIHERSVRVVARSVSPWQDAFHPSWSPDGQYLAFTQVMADHVSSVFVHHVASSVNRNLTRGEVDARLPLFDLGGEYLYFVANELASIADVPWGLASAELLMPFVKQRLYRARVGGSGSQTAGIGGPATAIEPLTIPVSGVVAIGAVDSMSLVVQQKAGEPTPCGGCDRFELLRLGHDGLVERDVVGAGFEMRTAPGSLLLRTDSGWRIFTYDGQLGNPRDLPGGEFAVNLTAEREQMLREVIRKVRDTFYDPNLHGQDLEGLREHYARFIPSIGSRREMYELFSDLLGHFSVSHVVVSPPAGHDVDQSSTNVGLLGADFEVSEGHYRFLEIFATSPWWDAAAEVQSPLRRTDIRTGEYLLAVDGNAVVAEENVLKWFKDTAGVPVVLTVSPTARLHDARAVTVVPIRDDRPLRIAAWAARNTAVVDSLSAGRVGYVHVPVWTNDETRSLLNSLALQSEKEAVIVDQRYNPGGITPDVVVQFLAREPLLGYAFRYAAPVAVPPHATRPLVVLLINERNASAAETFAVMFKSASLGPVVGKTTAGAGIGASLFQPLLVDGGSVRVPNRASFNLSGEWDIENSGVEPDFDVDLRARDWMAGRDSQLERSVEIALEGLPDKAMVRWKRPPGATCCN